MDASLLFGSAGGGIAMFYASPEYVCGFCCSLKLCFVKGGAEYTRVSIPTTLPPHKADSIGDERL